MIASKAARAFSRNVCTAPADLQAVLSHWSGGAVTLKRDGATARLILDRPEKNNCLSGHMMMQLEKCVRELEKADCSLIVVEGAGKSFCSGADLGLINEIASPHLGSEMFGYMSSQLNSLNAHDAIVIGKIHGHCLGGATEIASSCDLRIAHKDSKIGFLHARMGIIPSWGGAKWLAGIVGRSTALKLMATAPVLSAEDARKEGFVDFVYNSEEEAEKFISSFASNPPSVLKAQKAMLSAVKNSIEAEHEVIRSVWGGEAQKAALKKQIDALANKK